MSYAQKLRLPQRGSYLLDLGSLFSPSSPGPFLRSSTLFFVLGFGLRLRSYDGRKRRRLILLLFRRYIFRSHRQGTILSRIFSLLSLSPLAILLSAASIPSATRRETRRISSSRDFVDCNKCVCSSRRYRASSGRSFILRSPPACPPHPLIILF